MILLSLDKFILMFQVCTPRSVWLSFFFFFFSSFSWLPFHFACFLDSVHQQYWLSLLMTRGPELVNAKICVKPSWAWPFCWEYELSNCYKTDSGFHSIGTRKLPIFSMLPHAGIKQFLCTLFLSHFINTNPSFFSNAGEADEVNSKIKVSVSC